MDDTTKYLIHADVAAEGVIEGNDVVGAIFGQTEGLLGADLDLHELRHDSKVGRIDVDVSSADGRTTGELTVATGLDRVETALLAAALETIDQVGPCRATIEVTDLEDVRSAKRRRIVDRATELLADLEADSASSMDIVEAVRQRVRVKDVTTYEGYPAGPRVGDSDAVVVVEGRADVLQLLQFGVKNAVAVEGTDVPDAVADLTRDRTVTAFVDGDRGGELVLQELAQVGDVDYVAVAPAGAAVEDLSRREVQTALREKVPYGSFVDRPGPSDDESAPAADGRLAGARDGEQPGESGGRATEDGAASDAEGGGDDESDPGAGRMDPSAGVDETDGADTGSRPATSVERGRRPDSASDGGTATGPTTRAGDGVGASSADDGQAAAGPTDAAAATDEDADPAASTPETLAGHVEDVVGAGTGRVRLVDADAAALAEGDDAVALLDAARTAPAAVVVDGPVTQRLLDAAAQRGAEQVVGASEGEFVKRPATVRVRTAEDV